MLSLTKDKINFDTGEITFPQLKTKGKPRKTIITYPVSILNELRNYIGDRKGVVFVTRNGKDVLPTQVQNTFSQAGVAANIRFKVHPYVLRASAITEYKRLVIPIVTLLKYQVILLKRLMPIINLLKRIMSVKRSL